MDRSEPGLEGDVATTGFVPDGRLLIGLLAESNRRRILAAMILGATTIEGLILETGLTTREVVDALDRIEKAGLVEIQSDREGGTEYLLLEQAFELAARAQAPAKAASEFPDEPQNLRRILDRAIRDGRLLRMPSKRSHRLVVLDHVAQRFEPGERCTERQVNAMLVSVDTDTATLRRYLVDEAILDRADGFYWRIGGTFPTE